MAEARGDYVLFTAADDELRPGVFEHATRMLSAHPDAGLCSGICEWRCATTGQSWYNGGRMPNKACYLTPADMVELSKHGRLAINNQNTVYKKSALMEAGGWIPELHWFSDWFADCVVGFRHGMCHVPEGRGIFRTLSVRDNLRLQAPSSSRRDPIPVAAGAFPPLGERLTQRAGTLSGGEQQMLALAHAYVASARLVLLDEVSMGLAPIIVDEIFEHLRRLAAGGAAMLLVEQFVQRALDLADYVYVLKKGRIVFVGEPGQLGDSHLLDSYLGG
jgi:ABC-type polar amino acid transport system ATPase subunit